MFRLLPVLFLVTTALLQAVPFRAATFNIGAHFTSSGGESYPDYSLGDPGTPDFESVKAVLGRINADVVALEEIHSADLSGSPSDVSTMATALGYPYNYLTPVSGAFDTSLRVIFLSKYPILASTAITSPVGAKEITRFFPAVKIDIPGTTHDPLVIAGHLKSGTAAADKFRRAVEMKRLTGYLTAQGLTTDDNFIIMGDFNLSSSNATYQALPSGMPSTYDLGDDISYPVSYTTNPLGYFSTPAVTRITPHQLDGSTVTFPSSGSTIDLFLVSPAIAGRPVATEIYNSNLDTSNSAGLAKAGSPLAASTSSTASDHYAMFGDFELDADFPNLDLAVSTPSVIEGNNSALLTVTLPATRASSLTVTLSSDLASAATPASTTLVIPAGSLSASVAINTTRNYLTDGTRSVTFTASATGYDPDVAVLDVVDADATYAFNSFGQTITESFDGFDGTHAPSPWLTSGGSWLGADSGASSTGGFRAYGNGTEVSLGFLPDNPSTGTATASFENHTGFPLTALDISFTAEQWRVVSGGTTDTLAVSLVSNGVTTPLSVLTYHPATSGSPGSTAKSASISGLSIPDGASFDLQFSFTGGNNAVTPSTEVFVNEFHYDNTGTDTGEFVEIVVAPGFAGSLSDIDVVLYDGSGGASYDTKNLSTATAGSTVNGYRLFYLNYTNPPIQNGPDGIAVVNKTTGQVMHFISYEGSFTATNGPAIGQTSTNIGVSQSGSEAVGQSALGLTGSGALRSAFTWAKIAGVYTKGQPNTGQTFVVPTLASQGFAIDNLNVTAVATSDHDGDGLADAIDPDDDNDTVSDADEAIFGTDPFTHGPRFQANTTRLSATLARIAFASVTGRTYTVQRSSNLSDWQTVATQAGTGAAIQVDAAIPAGGAPCFFRVRVTLP